MRFIGSKTKLLPAITECIGKATTVADVFAGSCAVSKHLRSLGYTVYSNDWMAFSSAMALAYVCGTPEHLATVKPIIESWNFLDPIDGLICRNYGGTYFRDYSAGCIDAAVADLRHRELNPIESAICLTSIIEAADKVANTTGVYAAYLKHWQPNAEKRLAFQVPVLPDGPIGEVDNLDAMHFVRNTKADVYYLDPPYNQRQYHAYYHVPEVICSYARSGSFEIECQLEGKTRMPPYPKSLFCSSERVGKALIQLLELIPGRVVLSYNDEGLLTAKDILRCFEQTGRREPNFEEMSHTRYGAGNTMEWLFYDD